MHSAVDSSSPAIKVLIDALERIGEPRTAAAILSGFACDKLGLEELAQLCQRQGIEAVLGAYEPSDPRFTSGVLIFSQGIEAPANSDEVIEGSVTQGQATPKYAYQLVDCSHSNTSSYASRAFNEDHPSGHKVEVGTEQLSEFSGQACLALRQSVKLSDAANVNGTRDSKSGLFDTEVSSNRFSSWLWAEVWRYKSVYRDVLVASVMLNLFVVASPLFVMNVYDRVVPNQAVDTLWALSIGLVVVLLFDVLLKHLRHHFLEQSGRSIDLNLSKQLFAHVLNMKPEETNPSLGSSMSRFREFDSVKQFFSAATLTALVDLPFAALFLLIIFWVAGPVALAPALAAVVIAAYGAVVHFPLKRRVQEIQLLGAFRNSVLAESLATLETLKTYNAQSHAQIRWDQSSLALAQEGLGLKKLSDSIQYVSAFIVQLTIVLVVVIGVYQINEGLLSLGALIASVLLTSRVLGPMVQVANLATQYFQARSTLEDLNRLAAKPVEQSAQQAYLNHQQFEGGLALERAELVLGKRTVFEDLTLHIKPGEHVALIGTIGSGKTSLLRTWLGLNRVSRGQVSVDGIDIDQLNPADLRSAVAYVPQDIQLLSGTLRDNLNLGLVSRPDSELLSCLDSLGFGAYVRSHSMGLDMPIGEFGAGLSGGQRQSVALARAILKEPSILLLDEPTSAMDNQNESRIIQHLKTCAEGKTLVLSTHRASLLSLVERVIVMDAGRIVADGPKEQVLEALKKGLIGSGGRK